jgi:hypothetical protein
MKKKDKPIIPDGPKIVDGPPAPPPPKPMKPQTPTDAELTIDMALAYPGEWVRNGRKRDWDDDMMRAYSGHRPLDDLYLLIGKRVAEIERANDDYTYVRYRGLRCET